MSSEVTKADIDRLRQALAQAHGWITDAIESTGDSDDDLLAQPGMLWARLISARDMLAQAGE